ARALRGPVEAARCQGVPCDRRREPPAHAGNDQRNAGIWSKAAALAPQGDRARPARPSRGDAARARGLMATGAARLLELAFDPRVEGHEDPMSQRILDSALALVAA